MDLIFSTANVRPPRFFYLVIGFAIIPFLMFYSMSVTFLEASNGPVSGIWGRTSKLMMFILQYPTQSPSMVPTYYPSVQPTIAPTAPTVSPSQDPTPAADPEISKISRDTKLIFYGVFSIAKLSADRERIRYILKEQVEHAKPQGIQMEVKFILGNTNITDSVHEEAQKYGDIVILPVHENINEGKTYYYFKWVYYKLKHLDSSAMIFKADQDTFLCYELYCSSHTQD